MDVQQPVPFQPHRNGKNEKRDSFEVRNLHLKYRYKSKSHPVYLTNIFSYNKYRVFDFDTKISIDFHIQLLISSLILEQV